MIANEVGGGFYGIDCIPSRGRDIVAKIGSARKRCPGILRGRRPVRQRGIFVSWQAFREHATTAATRALALSPLSRMAAVFYGRIFIPYSISLLHCNGRVPDTK
ncbi:hypothetical protein G3N57_07085 [Paraburkholderia sp. Se-20369]|nr:hypothetical protein [Paraburkholderia sp. Se-20369]